jgi:hypothetical protein
MSCLRKAGIFIFMLIASLPGLAQKGLVLPAKIAVFAPVYTDSAIYPADSTKNALPRTALAGLDFYNGMQLAIDTLNTAHAPLEVLFYDTQSGSQPLSQVVTLPEFEDVSLILASFSNRREVQLLASFAKTKKIPLISVTYPNSGGVQDNPYFVLLNPTLEVHLEGIFRFLHSHYPTDSITVFTRTGSTGDYLVSDLYRRNQESPGLPLKLKTVALTDSFSVTDVLQPLDSTRKNIIYCASLDENFGIRLSQALGTNPQYHATIIGMPTWDALRGLHPNLDIIYSTPYNYDRLGILATQITQRYRDRLFGRPSDMVFKGYESMYVFSKLLLKYGTDMLQHLSDHSFDIFNTFLPEPVHPRNAPGLTSYLENHHLYFIERKDGMTKAIK